MILAFSEAKLDPFTRERQNRANAGENRADTQVEIVADPLIQSDGTRAVIA